MIDKAFATLATPKSVGVCVEADNVLLQGRAIPEAGRTEGAGVGSLSRVRSQVVGKRLPRNETGRAHMALVVLHSIVGLQMLGIIR